MLNKHSKILLYANSLWFLGEGMLGPLLAVFANRVGGNVLEISFAWAIYVCVKGIVTIIIGKYSDLYSKEKILVAGFALNALFTFCYLLVDSPIKLFIVQFGLAFAAALTIPTWQALYAKYEDKNHAGYVWGLERGMSDLMVTIAILTGGFIVYRFSFEALFIIMGTIQIIATIYQAKILRK